MITKEELDAALAARPFRPFWLASINFYDEILVTAYDIVSCDWRYGEINVHHEGRITVINKWTSYLTFTLPPPPASPPEKP
jgi:hypothetical protein